MIACCAGAAATIVKLARAAALTAASLPIMAPFIRPLGRFLKTSENRL